MSAPTLPTIDVHVIDMQAMNFYHMNHPSAACWCQRCNDARSNWRLVAKTSGLTAYEATEGLFDLAEALFGWLR